ASRRTTCGDWLVAVRPERASRGDSVWPAAARSRSDHTHPAQAARRRSADTDGLRALHAGPVHLAALAGVVVQGVVHRAAVVPDGQRLDGPAQTAGEVLVDAVAVQMAQQRL